MTHLERLIDQHDQTSALMAWADRRARKFSRKADRGFKFLRGYYHKRYMHHALMAQSLSADLCALESKIKKLQRQYIQPKEHVQAGKWNLTLN